MEIKGEECLGRTVNVNLQDFIAVFLRGNPKEASKGEELHVRSCIHA
jgi:hypothetical protein